MNEINIVVEEKTTSKIIFESDILSSVEKYFGSSKNFLITNKTLAKLYPSMLKKFDIDKVIIINDGEKYKNFKTYNFIVEKLLSQNVERKDTIFAFGGGVVGDLAGFVASSILRGINLVQIPTTLLAMCDSSIGGKTGFNSKYGKNLVGSFYFASKVIIDANFLLTLNKYEIKCGFGEIVKYALIEKSAKMSEKYDLIDILENISLNYNLQDIKNIVLICDKIKANVVELDKKESGLRKILNFGHTFAHPIETLSNYKGISHGEAVALGIKIASKLSYNLGKIDIKYYNRIISLLNKYELIDNKTKYSKDKFVGLMFQDKKVVDGKINLLLPVACSEVELFDNIDVPLIKDSLP